MKTAFAACLLLWGVRTAVAGPALTIYNENFAVVRDTVPLDLPAGTTAVQFDGVTAHLEPASVILRDPTGKVPLRIVEQNYRSEGLSQAQMLARFEGQTIPFLIERSGGKPGETVQGKIIRSGYVARTLDQDGHTSGSSDVGDTGSSQGAIIEVNGQLRFSLPGEPLFPSLGEDAVLRPRLEWKLFSPTAAKLDAELAYVTTSMDWHADYSVISPENGDTLDLLGLVTITNRSGKAFEGARVKLMAGIVNKVEDNNGAKPPDRLIITGSNIPTQAEGPPAVTVKSFDEYHLYNLPLSTDLQDQETKQVEFVRAAGIPSKRVYVYDGYKEEPEGYRGLSMDQIRSLADYGTRSIRKVHVLREFKNAEASGLGVALPKGRLRFYRRDDDGQLEFTGENTVDHTPRDETLSIYSGDAFDLVGTRTRTDFKTDETAHYTNESFEIRLRNHKKEPVEIRVVEHLYRWTNWTLPKPSAQWKKLDAQTMEARVTLAPDEERAVSYTVRYSW